MVDNSYLFILCPPFCGSTLMWNLLSTSPATSFLPSEGHHLPEVVDEMCFRPWDETRHFDWQRIKSVWHTYWDTDKPILVDKSPEVLCRARRMAQFFDPLDLVIMVRNPFAHAEGLMRRQPVSAVDAAKFAVECLHRQHVNRTHFPDSVVLRYEELVADPEAICERLLEGVPGLESLDWKQSFTIHSVDGVVTRPITYLDDRKYANLSQTDIAEMTKVFTAYRWVLDLWGYDPDLHAVRAADG